MSAIARSGAAVGIAVLAVGCGGGSGKQPFSAGDAQALATLRPTTPGWDWPPQRAEKPPFVRDLSGSSDGYIGGAESRWQDSTKLAHVDANIFESAAAAHEALPGFRAFARKWAKRDGGDLIDLAVKGLGQEAWRIQAGPAAFGEEVTYGWRRGNLVVEAHIQCIFITCRSDIGKAGLAWAKAIDAEAQSSS
jgi:hypothetical protein